MKKPYRSGSWGEKVYEILSKNSIIEKPVTINQLVATIVLDKKLRRPDMQKLAKKTYFVLWEMLNTKKLPLKVNKIGGEWTYLLKSTDKTIQDGHTAT